LNRKALDWLVAQQKTGRNTTSLDESIGDGGDDRASSIPDAIGISPDDHLAFAQAREVLPKHLRRIWDALIAEGLNKTRAAKRLGVHRNSMTNAMPRIAKVLRDHGF
jgi:DNA-directed RNA polymerase specialized sigma24 family protein